MNPDEPENDPFGTSYDDNDPSRPEVIAENEPAGPPVRQGTEFLSRVSYSMVCRGAAYAINCLGLRQFRRWPALDEYVIQAIHEHIESDPDRYQAAVELLQAMARIDLSDGRRARLAAVLAGIDAVSMLIGRAKQVLLDATDRAIAISAIQNFQDASPPHKKAMKEN